MNDLLTLSCPSCGGQLSISAGDRIIKCDYCGRQHFIERDVYPLVQGSHTRCPQCGLNDRVERVSAIVDAQTQKTIHAGPQEKEVNVGSIQQSRFGDKSVTHIEMSSLASQLAAPEKPGPTPKLKKKPGGCLLVLGIFSFLIAGFVGLMLIGSLNEQNSPDTVPILIFFLFFMITGVGLLIINSRNRRIKTEQYSIMGAAIARENSEKEIGWRRAMEKWQASYYCHRDGCVFIPEENNWAPLSQINEFLFR